MKRRKYTKYHSLADRVHWLIVYLTVVAIYLFLFLKVLFF